jgi:ABC-type anion transport system duplicated permease subunit
MKNNGGQRYHARLNWRFVQRICERFMDDEQSFDLVAAASERPWIVLKDTYDVEAWIDQQNYALQRLVRSGNNVTQGICFLLEQGGEIYLHTTQEGDVVLDVTLDAEWIAPLIAAAANVEVSNSQIWAIPGDRLTALIYGLNSLIATVKLVPDHNFKRRKY